MAKVIENAINIPEYSLSGKMLSSANLFVLPVSLLMGRSAIEGMALPLCTAFLALLYRIPVNRFVVLIVMLTGMVTSDKSSLAIQLIGAYIVLLVFSKYLAVKTGGKTQALGQAIAVLIPGTIASIVSGGYAYDFLAVLLHTFLAFALAFVFKGAAVLIEAAANGTTHVKSITSEQAISLTSLVFFSLSGIISTNFSGVPIGMVLGIFSLMLFSYRYGPGVGAAAGIIAGLAAILSSSASSSIAVIYAFCGMFCGFFRKLGKIGAILGFLLGNAVLTFYLSVSGISAVYFRDIIIASILFIILPKKFLELMPGNNTHAEIDQNSGYTVLASRLNKIVAEKLRGFAAAFSELSGTFKCMDKDLLITAAYSENAKIADRIASIACKECSMKAHCWERNFISTYGQMLSAFEQLDLKGRLEINDLPSDFVKRCGHIESVVEEINRAREIQRLESSWRSRLEECRNLLSKQLTGISSALTAFSGEIGVNLLKESCSEMEERIRIAIENIGIHVIEIAAFINGNGRHEVCIVHSGCGGRRKCIQSLEKIVSAAIDRNMTKETGECMCNHDNGICSLRLVEENIYKVSTGIAQAAKTINGVCGDNCMFMTKDDGIYIAAVSDGMGSGSKAAIKSTAAVNLLQNYIESGFDKDIAVNLVNSILVSCSDDETFATLDVVSIDTLSGKAGFIKAGAAPGFIKNGDAVESIRAYSLPAGILGDVRLEIMERKVVDGSMVILITDGVYEALESGKTGAAAYISGVNTSNPQELADILLSKALSDAGKRKNGDDMLVLAAKVWKKR